MRGARGALSRPTGSSPRRPWSPLPWRRPAPLPLLPTAPLPLPRTARLSLPLAHPPTDPPPTTFLPAALTVKTFSVLAVSAVVLGTSGCAAVPLNCTGTTEGSSCDPGTGNSADGECENKDGILRCLTACDKYDNGGWSLACDDCELAPKYNETMARYECRTLDCPEYIGDVPADPRARNDFRKEYKGFKLNNYTCDCTGTDVYAGKGCVTEAQGDAITDLIQTGVNYGAVNRAIDGKYENLFTAVSSTATDAEEVAEAVCEVVCDTATNNCVVSEVTDSSSGDEYNCGTEITIKAKVRSSERRALADGGAVFDVTVSTDSESAALAIAEKSIEVVSAVADPAAVTVPSAAVSTAVGLAAVVAAFVLAVAA